MSPDASSVTGATEERQPTVVSSGGRRSGGGHGGAGLDFGLDMPGGSGHRSHALWSGFAELGKLRRLGTCCRSNPTTSVKPGAAATLVTLAASVGAGT
jgi:hypothetical protein